MTAKKTKKRAKKVVKAWGVMTPGGTLYTPRRAWPLILPTRVYANSFAHSLPGHKSVRVLITIEY